MNNPWFALYVSDYLAKTCHLTQAQHGAYFLLMLHYYATGKPILANAKQLQAICKCTCQEDITAVDEVLRLFFIEKSDKNDPESKFYYHSRIEKEIANRRKISTKRKKIGRNGGLAKARNLLQQKATHSQSQSQSHTQSTKSKTKAAFVVPEWIPLEAWDSFEEMRAKIRKPMTDKARELAVRDLGLLKTEGYDLQEVIEQSVKQSWAGLFPLRGGSLGGKRPEPAEPMTAEEEAWARNFQAREKARVNGA